MTNAFDPCPFCGGTAEAHVTYLQQPCVRCTRCGAMGPPGKRGDERNVVYGWQIRTSDAVIQNLSGQLEAASEQHAHDAERIGDLEHLLEREMAQHNETRGYRQHIAQSADDALAHLSRWRGNSLDIQNARRTLVGIVAGTRATKKDELLAARTLDAKVVEAAKPSEPVATGERLTTTDIIMHVVQFHFAASSEDMIERYVQQRVKAACDAVRAAHPVHPDSQLTLVQTARKQGFELALAAVERSVK